MTLQPSRFLRSGVMLSVGCLLVELRLMSPTKSYIHILDEKTSVLLKFTFFNPEGRIWTMVAGGGASVIYAGPNNQTLSTKHISDFMYLCPQGGCKGSMVTLVTVYSE
ncbi:hypothetical protein MKW98_024664 [Papaver atlanticum]|uniref:ATP-citrate synthase citrate-binding domain-containing protein n=1 Tax=Papaver atlanticum TaxID=357466 RepID=A0AAD4X7V9_9MAGN|nr:hypothetical protein MKW98_024664 [Papaver atlanticum]